MKTKSKTCILILTLALAPIVASAQTLLVSYNFNDVSGNTVIDGSDNGNNAAISGTTGVIGASGSGVSGQAGDYAFDDTAATMSGTGSGILLANTASLANLTSFTISMWYNTESNSITTSTRFFDDNNNYLLGANNNGGSVVFNVPNGGGATTPALTSSSLAAITAQNIWTFIAITYDSTLSSDQLKLYVGSSSATASLAATATYAGGAITFANNLMFGANSSDGRALQGLLDDIAIYGSTTDGSGALNLSQIDTLQASAFAIPEPATCAALAGLAALGFVAVRRRRVPASR